MMYSLVMNAKSNRTSDPKVTKKRVACYVRVSTKEQELEGYSPEFQMEQILKHVERNDYKGWYTDKKWHFFDAKSGGDTVERKDLQKLMELVKNEEIEVVLVWRIDRLSRNLSDLLELFEEMNKHHVSFASVKEDLDFSGAIGKLIFQIFGSLAEFERENIKMRTDEGKKASAKRGNYIGGTIPYGYKKVPNLADGKGSKLARIAKEAEMVKKIFGWFVYEKKSPEWIAAELITLKVPKGISNARSEGTKWHSKTIERMLENEVYRGSYITNRHVLVTKKPEKYKENPKAEWVVSNVEPCVDDLLFFAAQKRLQDRHLQGSRRGGGKETYMLRGKLYEIGTGRKFVGYIASKGTKNYRRKQYKHEGAPQPSISIAARDLEGFVWKHLEVALNRPEAFLKYHEKQSDAGKKRKELIEYLALHEESLTRANKRIEKARNLLYEEKVPEDRVLADIARFETERDVVFQKKLKVEEELRNLSGYEVACADLRTFSAKLKKAVKKLTYEDKQMLVDMFVERIEMSETDKERRAKVFFRFDQKAIAKAIPEGRTKFAHVEANSEDDDSENGGNGGSGGA